MTSKADVELPMRLQLENALLATVPLLDPIFVTSMMIGDMRGLNRKWRMPSMPVQIDTPIPPWMTGADFYYALWSRGIQTAGGTIQWVNDFGTISLHNWFYVPKRHSKHAKWIVREMMTGRTPPAYGPMLRSKNIDMFLSRFIWAMLAGSQRRYNGVKADKDGKFKPRKVR